MGIQRVILISIDTLRADALGSYGSAAGASTNLDRFAAQGVRFETCISPAPSTLPSHATLLTGLHPLEHGLLIDGRGVLSANVSTLASILHAEGWKTGAVVSSANLHQRHGLDRGFSDYNDDLFSAGVDYIDGRDIPSANARTTTLAAINWLSEQPRDEKLFLFLHYIDPHAPYTPPGQYPKAFAGDRYLAEVAYTDEWIGKLAVFLEDHDLLAGTLFVITSDHGEHRGQHGMPTHGNFLYDEVLRVPLIFAGGGLPGGVVSRDSVGLIDIVPTLLGLLALPIPPDLAGLNLFGEGSPDPDRALMSVSYGPALQYGWSPAWSLSTRRDKFILAPRPEYFVKASDPGELQNVATSHPERVRALEQILRQRAARYLAHRDTLVAASPSSASAQGRVARGHVIRVRRTELELDHFARRDPKDMRNVILAMRDYHTAVTAGDYERAHAILSGIESQDPNIPTVNQERSRLFIARGQNAEFLSWLDRMPIEFRASATERYHRAVALGRLGRREEAIAALREIVELPPKDPRLRFELAKQLSLNDQPEEAMSEYRELLRMDPRSKAGRLNYALLLKQSGDRHAAVAELRSLIELHPTYAKAFRNLGLYLAGGGNRRGAIAMLEHAIELEPEAENRARTEELIAELKGSH